MARFEERSRRSLRDLLIEGKVIEIFRNPKNNNLTAVMDGVYLGIDHRVKEIVEDVADSDDASRKDAFKRLAKRCCIAELRQVDENGKPIVTGQDSETGKTIYASFIPCLVLDTSLKRADAEKPSFFEQNTVYASAIECMDQVNFHKVRRLSKTFLNILPDWKRRELHFGLIRGTEILNSEPLMAKYLYSYGNMHEAKLRYAFNKIPNHFLSYPKINIIDYGCGQALGTMCYADFIHQMNYKQLVNAVTLIDPSEICLKRAALHIDKFFPETKIITLNKAFDNLTQGDIVCKDDIPTLHIFSNVLDMDCFDYEKLSRLIMANLKGYNQFVCVSPTLQEENRKQRVYEFTRELIKSDYFYEALVDVTFHDRYFEVFPQEIEEDIYERWSNWTCTLSVFSIDKK